MIASHAYLKHSIRTEKVPRVMQITFTTFIKNDGTQITPNPIQIQYVVPNPLGGTDIHFIYGDVITGTAPHANVVKDLDIFIGP